MNNYSYLPELDYYFTNYIHQTAVLKYQPLRLPDVTGLFFNGPNIFNLIFNEKFSFTNFTYLFNKVSGSELPSQIDTRIKTSAYEIQAYTTGSINPSEVLTGIISYSKSFGYTDKPFQSLGLMLPIGATIIECMVNVKTPCIAKSNIPKADLLIGRYDEVGLLCSASDVDVFEEGIYKTTNHMMIDKDTELFLQLNMIDGNVGNFDCEILINYAFEDNRVKNTTSPAKYNILDLSEDAVFLLSILQKFRISEPISIEQTPEQFSNDSIAYLLCIYLQGAINKNFDCISEINNHTGTTNVFQNILAFYVADACTRMLSTESKIDMQYPQPFWYRQLFNLYMFDFKTIHSFQLDMPVLKFKDEFVIYKNSYEISKELYSLDIETNIVTFDDSVKFYKLDVLLIDYMTEKIND